MLPLQEFLKQQQAQDLYRTRKVCEGPQGPRQVCDNKQVLSFCSNDYLGLAAETELAESMRKATEKYGVGSGAAHLVNGHSEAHHALEEELADFLDRDRVLLFSTGYMANLGIAQALVGRGDVVLEDRLNHASLLDAGLLSGARFSRYAHVDVNDAKSQLNKYADKEKLLLTDGVFSMDGDIAPLSELAKACVEHDSWLMVDDAHGFGVLGENGGGCVEQLGLGVGDVPILMGTLGKAFGTSGAFVAADEDVIETLIQNARTYIYTTATPPALAEATRASLKLVRSENWRREHLAELIKQFRHAASEMGYQLMDSSTPIQPILLGDSQKASEMSEQLLAAGIHIGAIRPPTVAEGTARLRITFSAEHSFEQLNSLLNALNELKKHA